MSAVSGRLRAWIELARLSNAPTVLTNALTGAAIGAASAQAPFRTGPVAATAAGVLLLYAAGMVLNDVVDAGADRVERPGRPIPSGRISAPAAGTAGVALLLLGVLLCGCGGGAAMSLSVVLAAAVVVYELIHKATAASVILLGLCRALVYVTVAASAGWPVDWSVALPLAGALGLYVVLLSVAARAEVRPERDSHKWPVFLLLMVAISPQILVRPAGGSWLPFVAGALIVVWLALSLRHLRAQPPRVERAVGDWLAGICLMDGLYLVLLDRPAWAAAAGACFIATIIGHRFVKGS